MLIIPKADNLPPVYSASNAKKDGWAACRPILLLITTALFSGIDFMLHKLQRIKHLAGEFGQTLDVHLGIFHSAVLGPLVYLAVYLVQNRVRNINAGIGVQMTEM